MKVGCFEARAHDFRAILRLVAGKEAQPTAAAIDGRPLQPQVKADRGLATTATSVAKALRCIHRRTR
jgi:hypothetical protein